MRAHVVITAAILTLLCIPALPMAQARQPDPKSDALKKALAAKPTPKTADGHPDLNGRWQGLNTADLAGYSSAQGNVHVLAFGKPIPGANAETDAVLTDYGDTNGGGGSGEDRRRARQARSKPAYKPEFEAKVEMMGKDPNHYDPTNYSCLPPGVPRIGAPAYIIQTPGRVVLFYESGQTRLSTFRMIPTDGRRHRTNADDYDPNPMGDPVGHWEGNTLIIESIGFDESTWFGSDGYFHSDAMRVTERFTRKGDTLEYSTTVEDPTVLTKPFDIYPMPMTLKKGGDDLLYNYDVPCDITKDPFRDHADHENHL